ncbi:hypothetical protein C8R46DRAFT_1087995 [Mycena filopes]|nr:hypothetical protein C8R46DRAFT_1087995 [Mycena filopes]
MSMSPARRAAMAKEVQQLPDPSNVYKANTILLLHTHILPAVSLAERDVILDDQSLAVERSVNGRLINCVRHTLEPSSASSTVPIKLLEPLSTGLRDLRIPQVWKVECEKEICVARIYDPLYIDDETGMYDVFVCIARVMLAEVNAYEKLVDLQGNLIPQFMGCFLTVTRTTDNDLSPGTEATSDIPVQRGVQILLFKYIPGMDLTRLRPAPESPVCDAHKIAVLHAVDIAGREMDRRGVFHYDLAERNIIFKKVEPSSGVFCEDPACRLRSLLPTDAQEFEPTSAFPIGVIDFEDTTVGDSHDRLLITEWDTTANLKNRFNNISSAWFLE